MPGKMKKLVISAAAVDATKVTEEKIAVYDSISINTAFLLTAPAGKEILSRHGVEINAATILEGAEGCKFRSFNGSKTIGASDRAEGPAVMVINGSATVLPDGMDSLRSYEAVMINGSLLYPESAGGLVGNVQVNGSSRSYPAEAVVLEKIVTVDPFFIRRAQRGALYFIPQKLVIEEEGLDLAALQEKNVRFMSPDAVINGSYVEQAAALLTEDARARFFPAGYRYAASANNGLKSLIAQFGKSLYIDGDLSVEAAEKDALSSLDALEVSGTVKVAEELESVFYQKCLKCGSVEVIAAVQGVCISGVATVAVSRQLLEESADGVSFSGIAQIVFDEDIPSDLIRARILSIQDCGHIRCTRQQQSVLLPLCQDVGEIRTDDLAEETEDPWVTHINCAHYAL